MLQKNLNNLLLKANHKIIKIKRKIKKERILKKKVRSFIYIIEIFLFIFCLFYLFLLVEEPKPKIVENDDDEGEWVQITKKQKSGKDIKKTNNDDYLELF